MKQPNDMTRLLSDLGVADLQHAGQSYVSHCIGVHDALASWGYSEVVRRAGFMHSIYGTERFLHPSSPPRQSVQEAIGAEAETLAYINCSLRRDELDVRVLEDGQPSHLEFNSRLGGERISIAGGIFKDVLAIQLADWLDQLQYTREFNYRYASYKRMVELVGGSGLFHAFLWGYRTVLNF